MRFRECPRCGCAYNRKGNWYCVECHARLPWLFGRSRRAPVAVAPPPPPPPPPAPVSLPPPDLRVPFGPRQGEPISPTGLRLAMPSWRTRAAAAGAVAVAVLTLAVAVIVAVLQNLGGR